MHGRKVRVELEVQVQAKSKCLVRGTPSAHCTHNHKVKYFITFENSTTPYRESRMRISEKLCALCGSTTSVDKRASSFDLSARGHRTDLEPLLSPRQHTGNPHALPRVWHHPQPRLLDDKKLGLRHLARFARPRAAQHKRRSTWTGGGRAVHDLDHRVAEALVASLEDHC